MRVLIIDNKFDLEIWGAEDLRRLCHLLPGATLYVRRGPQEDLPSTPKPFDYIIVSGSKASVLDDAPWTGRLHDFILRAIDDGKPFLGICYGHQSLVRAIGGKNCVRQSPRPEFGWTSIQLLESAGLMRGLPKKFFSFSFHREEVAYLPAGIKSLAKSDHCEVQACQLEGRPVFGIQFHPEKTLEAANQEILKAERRGEKVLRVHPGNPKKIYDPKIGETIFLNFFNYGKQSS